MTQRKISAAFLLAVSSAIFFLTLSNQRPSIAGQEYGDISPQLLHTLSDVQPGDLILCEPDSYSYGPVNCEALGAEIDYVDGIKEIPAFYVGDSMDIEIGDLDNDGLLDAVVGTFDYTVNISLQNKIYWNNGDGTWTEADELGETSAWAVGLYDFDGNGFLDIMTGNYGNFFGGTQNNFLYYNNGDRTFNETLQFGAGCTTDAYILDINGDGLMDVLNPTAYRNYQYINNGDGSWTQTEVFPTGNTMELDLFDIDSDGDLDALKGEYSGTSTYRINEGGGSYTVYNITDLTVGDIEVIDYNKDGRWDFVVGLHGQNLLYTNNDNTSWTVSNEFGNLNTNDLIIYDFDGNGYDDVIVANGSWGNSQDNYIYYNNGDSTWTPVQMFGAGSTYDINVVDIDSNGKPDVVAANWKGIDYIYANGYYNDDRIFEIPLDQVEGITAWNYIEVDETLPDISSITYTIYPPDLDEDNDCEGEPLVGPTTPVNSRIDISSIDAGTYDQICIEAIAQTSYHAVTPALNSLFVHVERTPSNLGGRVWNDLDGDGIRDSGEPALSGIPVSLYSDDLELIDTIETGSSGGYMFSGIQPNTYVVQFPEIEGLSFTIPNAGSNDSLDSDALPSGYTEMIVILPGDTDTSVDAGYLNDSTETIVVLPENTDTSVDTGYVADPFDIRITAIGSISPVVNAPYLLYYFLSEYPVISGETEPFATVYFETIHAIYSTRADADGDFSIMIYSPSLFLGTNSITYYAVDENKNSSPIKILDLVVGCRYFPAWLYEQYCMIEQADRSIFPQTGVNSDGDDRGYTGTDTSGPEIPQDAAEIPEDSGSTSVIGAISSLYNQASAVASSIVKGVYISDIAEYVEFIPLATGTASVAILTGFSFADLEYYLFRSYTWLVSLISGIKKREPWGVVYDSITKDPITRAVVRLYRSGELVETAVTDIMGVFSFPSQEGECEMQVRASGYTFPSTIITSRIDGIRQNVYHGGTYIVKKGTAISVHIPLDQEVLTDLQKYVHRVWSLVLSSIILINPLLLLFGVLFSWIAYRSGYGSVNLILAAMNCIFFVFCTLRISRHWKSWGIVLDEQGNPAGGIEIGIYDTRYNKLIDSRISDEMGRFRFILPGGRYILKPTNERQVIVEPGFEGGYLVGEEKPSEQVITEQIVIRKI